nr:MAG TPA: hypothetical protein [Caudoviricetes sp.]
MSLSLPEAVTRSVSYSILYTSLAASDGHLACICITIIET